MILIQNTEIENTDELYIIDIDSKDFNSKYC